RGGQGHDDPVREAKAPAPGQRTTSRSEVADADRRGVIARLFDQGGRGLHFQARLEHLEVQAFVLLTMFHRFLLAVASVDPTMTKSFRHSVWRASPGGSPLSLVPAS